MDAAAFYGLAGQIVHIIEPYNEPCPEALLGHFLIGFGNMLGPNVYMEQGGRQHTNDFGLFIGPSGIGRKGTAWDLDRRLFWEVDRDWTAHRVQRFFQSGESIIHAIRDSSTKGTGKHAQFDPGIDDKRLTMLETEFTRFLAVANRRGNNLLDTLRDCWDSPNPLSTNSKTAAEHASNPHISLIGHTTPQTYLRALPEEEKTNGSVNRSLIFAVRRVRKVSSPKVIRWKGHVIIVRLKEVLKTFSTPREMRWSKEAFEYWDKFYSDFDTKTKGGMVSSILDRLPTHVVRIAMIYCALDNSCLISLDHLKAAIGVCDYCRRSAQWIFDVTTGNRRADRLYRELVRTLPEGLSRSEIAENVFNKRISKAELDELLELLIGAELIYVKTKANPRKGPRFLEKWYAVK
jgi:hypothetical protein